MAFHEDTLLAGATGLVGREIVRAWRGPGTLHQLVRRPLEPAPGTRVQVVDFAALPALPPAGIALCALGTTIKDAGSQGAFRAVDFDAVLAFAKAAKAAGVTRFGMVSALGAEPRSGNFYSRVKGEAEAAVLALGFESVVIARPSLLVGDRRALGQPRRPGEAIAQGLFAPMAPLIPRLWRPVPAAAVARALLAATAEGRPGLRRLTNGEIGDFR